MTTFERGDIVRVPFPFVERDKELHRPALVVSLPLGRGDLVWALMITSAVNERWPGDEVIDHGEAGLTHPSMVRTSKIAAIEIERAGYLGRLGRADWQRIEAHLRSNLGMAS